MHIDLFILLTIVFNALYYMPGIVLGTRNILVNKIDNPCCHRIYSFSVLDR